ncbi:MAG: transcriptional repressor, LexA family [Chlorobi bacterium]|nr:transcriptional repressor, LexA family [Chlorobiota bacterium]
MQELTPRQASILKFIETFFHKHQQPPTEREIAEHFRIHQSAIRKHLTALENKGRLSLRRDGRSRGIRLNNQFPTVSVPIVGSVVAGAPLLAIENIEGAMMLDMNFIGSEEVFLLRVRGDSMIEAGILEDDLILVRRTEKVRNGEIVVARLGDETTVKRFFNIAGRIVLEPANKSYRPIPVDDSQTFYLEGRVVALIRNMDNFLMINRKN